MKTKDFTLTIKGSLWRIHEVSIENIDMTQKLIENAAANMCEIKIHELIFEDEKLDVFIKLGAPNGTTYTVEAKGKLEGAEPLKVFSYSQEYTVLKNGRINILISEPISNLLKNK
jgi:hypothetical protein